MNLYKDLLSLHGYLIPTDDGAELALRAARDRTPNPGPVAAPTLHPFSVPDQGAIMDRPRRIYPLAAFLLVIGAAGLSRVSDHVRSVDAVGLSGAGFALGVGFALLALAFTGKLKS